MPVRSVLQKNQMGEGAEHNSKKKANCGLKKKNERDGPVAAVSECVGPFLIKKMTTADSAVRSLQPHLR
jgi:hypothetical protein